MEFTLLAAAATGAAAVWLTNRLRSGRISVDRPTDTIVGAAAAGLLLGRLAAMIGAGVNPVTNPGDILVVRGGVSTGFAALGAITVLAWTHRQALPTALDQLAPAAVAGLAGWHGGCLWRNTCLGEVSDLPWAMASTGTAVTRHPVELYAAAGMLLVAVLASRLATRPWHATGAALAGAGTVRLLTEPLRVSIAGGPVWWYAAAVVVGVAIVFGGQRAMRTIPPGPGSIEITPP
ncbi:MAG TPA: prolipoprotein diacylglyceryl transferase family protein [Acidimicrobiia bacterium]|nr:prolipoprotein diacylglyceryl transferase family protein [Acidimicrobiia bacterium]